VAEVVGVRQKTAERVAGQVRARIIRGELSEGDTLPSESEFAHQLGIARPTLREALRILESEGLVEIRRGAGSRPIVKAPRRRRAAYQLGFLLQLDGTTLADVHAARAELLSTAARLAATQADVGQLQKLSDAASALAAAVDDRRQFLRAGVEFNAQLLDSCGNDTLAMLGQVLGDLIEHHHEALEEADWWAGDSAQRARAAEVAGTLVERIRRGQAAAAERLWREQMARTTETWMREPKVRSLLDLLS
jgi:DNA-binding FadR family transcriptional regulator